MGYLDQKAETLKSELVFLKSKHEDHPTTLQATYKQDVESSLEARKIADLLAKKELEINEFVFMHPEYADIFEGGDTVE